MPEVTQVSSSDCVARDIGYCSSGWYDENSSCHTAVQKKKHYELVELSPYSANGDSAGEID